MPWNLSQNDRTALAIHRPNSSRTIDVRRSLQSLACQALKGLAFMASANTSIWQAITTNGQNSFDDKWLRRHAVADILVQKSPQQVFLFTPSVS